MDPVSSSMAPKSEDISKQTHLVNRSEFKLFTKYYQTFSNQQSVLRTRNIGNLHKQPKKMIGTIPTDCIWNSNRIDSPSDIKIGMIS